MINGFPAAITREDQHFFINRDEVPGVQNVEIQYDVAPTNLKYLGLKNTSLIPNGPQIGTASISTILITDDFFLKHMGQSGFNGYLLRGRTNNTNNISFVSGYLTSYTSRCSIGQFPEINANVSIYGDIGTVSGGYSTIVNSDLLAISGGTSQLIAKLAFPGSINITLSDATTNRVISYDISLNINRLPIYSLGSRFPIAVGISYPIEVNCQFQIELDQHDTRLLRDFPFASNSQTISVAMNDFDSGSQIVNYSFADMILVQDRYSASLGNKVMANLTFRGNINR